MNIADVIASFATNGAATKYQVTRRARALLVRGRAQPPTTLATISITASVQPATGRDLLKLPELRRSVETRVLFTDTQLMVGGEGTADSPNLLEADLVQIDGDNWEVQHVESWEASPITDGAFYRCIVQSSAS